MFGCLRRLGCLVVLLIAAAAAYLYRDRWLGLVDRATGNDAPAAAPATTPAADGTWEPLTPAGAARARSAVESLGRRSGPVFTNVRAGDLASYIFTELAQQLPPSADDVQAAVRDGRLYLRASVRLADLGGGNVLGPLAGFLGDREQMEFGGRFEVVRPGLAQFRVEDVRLREFSVPRAVIPKLIGQIRRGTVPEGVSADGLPLQIPPSIGDVRIAGGRVVLYKSEQ